MTLTVTGDRKLERQPDRVYVTTLAKDTVAPVAPTVTLNPLDDSGVSSSDYITNVTAPRITVTAEAGATITVYVNGSLYTGQTLAPGNYTVTATATDAVGNTSADRNGASHARDRHSGADRQLRVQRLGRRSTARRRSRASR